ncbi:DUF262 domain-containing protein [Psychrobacter alimentarius]|uniref:DUF262 domain-containing protein n=1 Tax=Psychrobacter alimentarius TaxID=261164 RepID=UPI003FD6B33B
MDKGEKITFCELFNRVERVEIPIIQRDYAQGREDQHEVRNLFLDALSTALTKNRAVSNQSLDLDFIYGSIESDKSFSVLDGQQRLTTLFLLHWFLAVKNNCTSEFRKHFTLNNKSRFSYKTRPSSAEFFDALTSDANFEDKFHQSERSNKLKISELISDCKWFFSSWKLDPTVQACLHMLDAIEQKFSSVETNLYQRLTETEISYITFQYLELQSFGLTDELYIKMNARGKSLTSFEHFKAKLEQTIKSYSSDWPIYQLDIKGFDDAPVDGYRYFIHKIDTDWADLFWPYRNIATKDNTDKDNTYDDELMNFIRLIILYQYLLDNNITSNDFNKEDLSSLLGTGSKLLTTTISQYDKLKCLNQAFIKKLINWLDILYKTNSEESFTTYLSNNKYYDENEVFKKVLQNDTDYKNKLRFFAFYSYLAKNEASLNQTDLMEWTRVIYNLTENTIVDGTDIFYRTIQSISSLSDIKQPILNILTSETKITGFSGDQVLEEKIKAHLILKSGDWRDKILEAEGNTFLNGQIGCLLNFSGILEYYRQHNNCDWDDSGNSKFFEKFSHYFEAIKSVMSYRYPEELDKKLSAEAIDFLWERAVLTKGIYFTNKTQNRRNLLSSDNPRNNIERDYSWKRLLRIESDKDVSKRLREPKQDFVKQLIDDSHFEFNTLQAFKSSLQNICDIALESEELEDWRRYLIRYPNLYSYCEQGFIQIDNQMVFLLWQSQRNHYHSELYTVVLDLQLKDELEKLVPFSNLEYQYVKSTQEQASLKIKDWNYASSDYYFEILKASENFIVRFINGSSNDYPQKVTDVIENNGFQREYNQDDETAHYETTSLTSVDDVISQLIQTCSSLRSIENE